MGDIYYKTNRMKKIKMNNTNITNLVMETLERDGVFVGKTKIDSAIKGYLVEREEMLLDDELPAEGYGFSDETKLAFGDMVGGLTDTIEDLSIIQVKESGIVFDDDSHSEDYLEDIITDLEDVVERLGFLKGLE